MVTTHTGITLRENSYTHQALEDIALMHVIPDMKVISLADAVETKKSNCCNRKNKNDLVYVWLARSDVSVLFNED